MGKRSERLAGAIFTKPLTMHVARQLIRARRGNGSSMRGSALDLRRRRLEPGWSSTGVPSTAAGVSWAYKQRTLELPHIQQKEPWAVFAKPFHNDYIIEVRRNVGQHASEFTHVCQLQQSSLPRTCSGTW